MQKQLCTRAVVMYLSVGHTISGKVEKENHNPYWKGKFGNCSLHYAAGGGRVNVLRYFIDSKGCSHSPEGQFKQTPLQLAAQYGKINVVKYFIEE